MKPSCPVFGRRDGVAASSAPGPLILFVRAVNVTIRKTLGLYANVRPCVSYSPFIKTHHPKSEQGYAAKRG